MAKHEVADIPKEIRDPIELAKQHCLLHGEEDVSPEVYPDLGSLSPRFFYRFLPIPARPEQSYAPEYVYVTSATECGLTGPAFWQYYIFVSMWNNTWEAGRARPGLMSFGIPESLRWVSESDVDLRLVHRAKGHSYDAYAPLFHLLPKSTLDRFGLPHLRRGLWPQQAESHLLEHVLPRDFDARLEEAVTFHLWPLLGVRGAPSCFSSDDPIRMLSHNLDYWLPYLDSVAQERARSLGRTGFNNAEDESDFSAQENEMRPGFELKTPLYGGSLWLGEEDSLNATREMIEIADKQGDFRSILDAVRSNRIQDDFSARWSFEREDFERKLFSKRNKIKVTFVELDETIPVHGAQSEVHENLFWEDLCALMDAKDRRIIVCLRNGVTRVGDIAEILGYKNHSPISKRLARIRRDAKKLLDR
jgi:hypothetical protein